MPPLLQLQKLPGKGDGGWKKKCLCIIFWWTRRSQVRGKNGFGVSYSMSNKLLLVARHGLTTGLQKMSLKLAVLLLNSQIHCHHLPLWRKYAPEVKADKGLKRCRAKVKGVNNSAWIAQYAQREGWNHTAELHPFHRICLWGIIVSKRGLRPCQVVPNRNGPPYHHHLSSITA